MPDDVVDCHDTTAPAVSSFSPTDGAATVALDANVEVRRRDKGGYIPSGLIVTAELMTAA